MFGAVIGLALVMIYWKVVMVHGIDTYSDLFCYIINVILLSLWVNLNMGKTFFKVKNVWSADWQQSSGFYM